MTKKILPKNKGGRPLKFESVEKLEEAISGYLEVCESKREITNKAGLCSYLKINRDTYCEWKKKDHKFSDAIKDFERVTENAWVQRLNGNAPTGAIFYLKNAFREDYQDRKETDITSGGEKILVIPHQLIEKNDNSNESSK